MIRQQTREQNPFDEHPPLKETIGDLSHEIALLTKATTELLKQELKENAVKTKRSAMGVALGGSFLFMAVFLAMVGIVIVLIDLLSPAVLDVQTAAWVATLSLALIAGLGGWITLKTSLDKLTSEDLVPRRTMETLGDHYEWFTTKLESYFK